MAKNKSGERKKIKEETKKKADCRSSVERIEASEKQKKVDSTEQHKNLKKSGRKIESGSIQRLRVAENRQEKRA